MPIWGDEQRRRTREIPVTELQAGQVICMPLPAAFGGGDGDNWHVTRVRRTETVTASDGRKLIYAECEGMFSFHLDTTKTVRIMEVVDE